MPTIELPSREASQKDIDYLSKEIQKAFKEFLYAPLVQDSFKLKNSIQNSRDDIIQAIRTGRVKFFRGVFTGKFNASISRELRKMGAKFDRRQGRFRVKLGALPVEVQEAIRLSESLYLRRMEKIDQKLSAVIPEKLAKKMSIKKILDRSIFRISTEISKDLDGITVIPTFSKEAKEKILDEYTQNMELDIKNWTEKEIIKLRKTMQKHVIKGMRYEDMIETIQNRYMVGKSKARFWARQETNLLVSKIKEIRYNEAGVNEYIWKNVIGSPKHPVRPMHKALNNTVHRFDDPPTINEKGDRKNPGEDYNCRCTARPIVRF